MYYLFYYLILQRYITVLPKRKIFLIISILIWISQTYYLPPSRRIRTKIPHSTHPYLAAKIQPVTCTQNYFLSEQIRLDAHELSTLTVTERKKTEWEKMQDLYINNSLYKGNGITPSFFFDIEHNATASNYGESIIDYLDGRIAGFRNGQ